MNSYKRLTALITVMALIVSAALMVTSCKSVPRDGGGNETQSETTESKEEAPDDVLEKVAPPEDFELAGDWQDMTSQRAIMTIIAEEENKYDVEINWGDSAEETTTWTFSGEFDMTGGMLYYDDCQKIITSFKDGEMKEKVEYKGGKGSILYYDGYLKWEDKEEDAGKDCRFEYLGEEEAAD